MKFFKKSKVMSGSAGVSDSSTLLAGVLPILKQGPAQRVIFFYTGEEGTYVDNVYVTLYANGIVHLKSNQEDTTTHLQNCEILWRFEVDADDRSNKVRLLKPKQPSSDDRSPHPEV